MIESVGFLEWIVGPTPVTVPSDSYWGDDSRFTPICSSPARTDLPKTVMRLREISPNTRRLHSILLTRSGAS